MKKLLSIAAILMLAAGRVLAGTISVDVNDPACVSGVGQPDPYAVVYCSIQDAIDDAASSDVINVADGTYGADPATGRCAYITKDGLSLIGESETGTIIDGAIGGVGSSGSYWPKGIHIQANNVTIQNFTVQGFTGDLVSTGGYGVLHRDYAHDTPGEGYIFYDGCSVDHVTVHSCYSVVYALCFTNLTVADCYLHDNYSDGMFIARGSDGAIIHDNIVTNSGDQGIWVGKCWSGLDPSDNATIYNNTVNGAREGGICFVGSDVADIYNNSITNAASEGWSVGALNLKDGPTNVNAYGNRIFDNDGAWNGYSGLGHGVGIDGSAGNINLHDNAIYGNSGLGVYNISTKSSSGTWEERLIEDELPSTSEHMTSGSSDKSTRGLVLAEANWWGDASGPYNATTNPSATGDAVSDDVDYSPWWGADYVDDPHTSPWTWYVNTSSNSTIQEGIDAASASVSDVINVVAGTYREQLYVDHSLDLLGAGIGVSIIEAPDPVDRTTYSITQWTGPSRTIDAIIGVVAAGNVNISGFTVDGRDVGPNNFYGVHFFDTDGSVTLCEIDNITDAATPSNSRVVSVVATHSLGQTFTIDFSSNSIPVFQKGGILIMGPGATFTVNENTVVNVPSPVIAGNGIQLSYGATGTTHQNVVQGAEYTGDDWAATGILLFESGDVSMDGDEVYNCQSGVDFSDWGWVYLHPSPVNLSFTNLNLYDNEWTLGIQLSRDNSDVNMTVTDCDILNSTGDGIDLYCTGEDPWGGSYYTGWENGDLNATITGCYVSGTALDGIWGGDYSGNVNNVSVSVFDCMFTGNVGSAINNGFTQIMDASGCYWDDPTGPTIGVKAGGTRPIMLTVSPFGSTLPEKGGSASTGLIASDKGSGETIYGNIDYTPWLTGGSPTSPGFQGDFATLWIDDDSPQSGEAGRIQEGIDLVTGSTVNVAAGTYHNDPTDVNKQVTLLGANADVDPAGSTDRGNETILTRDDTKSGFYVTASGVTINGFKLGTDTPQSSRRVNIHDGATDVTIKYNIIMNTWEWSGHGVYISPTSDRAEVSYNTVDNPYWEGIRNNGASDVVISNNHIRNVDNFPILVSGRTVISGNTVSDCKDGIRVDYAGSGTGDRVEVTGNTVSYTEYAGINITGAHAYVHNNTVHHCNYWGSDDLGDWDYASIHMEASATNCIIEGNTVYDGVNGIQTWANDVTITANEIYDMGVTYGDEKVVGDRTYKNSGILVGSNWGSGDIDPTGVVIHDNSIHDNYWGLFYSADLSNGVNASGNNWGASDGPEDTDGTDEAYIGQCFPVESMLNIVAEFFPTEGLGNAVSDNVNYCPWIPWTCCVVRGDIDHSGGAEPINITDLVYLVDYMFNEGPQPICLEEADMDATGEIDIADLVYLVDYMFNQGPEPVPCP